jgi:hypothetical protein
LKRRSFTTMPLGLFRLRTSDREPVGILWPCFLVFRLGAVLQSVLATPAPGRSRFPAGHNLISAF